MRKAGLYTLLIVLGACSAVEEKIVSRTTASIGSSTTTFSCSYYGEYDSYSTCQADTLANCSSEWKVFPGGGTSLCFKPYDGWEVCSQISTDWVYTPWTNFVCVVAGATYRVTRSVIECSSATCACMTPPVTEGTCEDGLTCPVSLPIPDVPAVCP